MFQQLAPKGCVNTLDCCAGHLCSLSSQSLLTHSLIWKLSISSPLEHSFRSHSAIMQLKSAVAAASVLLLTLSNCSSLTPPVLPLIVRNPYLNTWLGNARDVPWSKWPMFWTGQEIGFSILASVPDNSQVYPLLGRPHDSLLPVRKNDG